MTLAGLTRLVNARLAEAGLAKAGWAWDAATLLSRDRQEGFGKAGRSSANGSCHILTCQDGAAAINLARAEDWEMLPALMQGAGENLQDLRRFAAHMKAADFVKRAALLQLPAADWAEAQAQDLATPAPAPSLHGRRVLDMSALWAGPLCGALLAEAGAEVTRIHSIGRPDPTAQHSPILFQRLHGKKQTLNLDLRREADRAILLAMIGSTDMLITSARPAALARLGLDAGLLHRLNPTLIWCAITAYGFTGAGAQRVGFGDDCAFAGGLGQMTADGPIFMGDALADPLTGLESALAMIAACEGGQAGLLDMAMSGIAAAYAAMLGPPC